MQNFLSQGHSFVKDKFSPFVRDLARWPFSRCWKPPAGGLVGIPVLYIALPMPFQFLFQGSLTPHSFLALLDTLEAATDSALLAKWFSSLHSLLPDLTAAAASLSSFFISSLPRALLNSTSFSWDRWLLKSSCKLSAKLFPAALSWSCAFCKASSRLLREVAQASLAFFTFFKVSFSVSSSSSSSSSTLPSSKAYCSWAFPLPVFLPLPLPLPLLTSFPLPLPFARAKPFPRLSKDAKASPCKPMAWLYKPE